MFDFLTSSGSVMNAQVTQGLHDVMMGLLTVLLGLATWGLKLLLTYIEAQVKMKTHGLYQIVASRVVKYVEQRMIKAASPEKQVAAVAALSGYFPRLSSEEINHLIEEAVNDLKSFGNENKEAKSESN